MKKDRLQQLVLEQLRRVPIIQVAAEKVGISRSTIYRCREESEQYRKEIEEAMNEGDALINDMSESQLLTLMKDKHWPSIRFWLERLHPKFRNRIDINANLQTPQEELSPEQQAIVQEALRLAGLMTNKDINDHDEPKDAQDSQ